MIAVSRILFSSKNSRNVSALRLLSRDSLQSQPAHSGYVNEQIDYIKSLPDNHIPDWSAVRNIILGKPGSINEKNFEGVFLKTLVNNQRLDHALSFAEHLRSSSKELTLGSINGLLGLYYTAGLKGQISEKERAFILECHTYVYNKYKVLDYTTCEKLLHALCIIDEWEKSFKVLENIHLTSTPSHSAYSTLIATLFKNNQPVEAKKLIGESLCHQRPLLTQAYDAWIEYIFRKYKSKKAITNHVEEICLHISNNFVTVDEDTAVKIKETFSKLGWKAQFTKIKRQDGQCVYCKQNLDCLKLTEEEFKLLQQNVKDKLIVGSDLFLKTSPKEINEFQKFVERTAPYDVVLDALNIAFASKAGHNMNKVIALTSVVEHFKGQKKKMLLLGRKHMLTWPKKPMEYLMSNTCSFFTDNLSQDDPFFITAAILSGSHTDIVSKDLLRGHRFAFRDERQRLLFRRWQWQHQWMLFQQRKGIAIQPPLSFTPCAQQRQGAWHLPWRREGADNAGQVADGSPDWGTWLCIQPPR